VNKSLNSICWSYKADESLWKIWTIYGFIWISNDIFMDFLKHHSGSCVALNGEYKKLSDFIKKIFICFQN